MALHAVRFSGLVEAQVWVAASHALLVDVVGPAGEAHPVPGSPATLGRTLLVAHGSACQALLRLPVVLEQGVVHLRPEGQNGIRMSMYQTHNTPAFRTRGVQGIKNVVGKLSIN